MIKKMFPVFSKIKIILIFVFMSRSAYAGYAEDLYRYFSLSTKNQIKFTVSTLNRPQADELINKKIGDLTGIPEYNIATVVNALKIESVRFETVNTASIYLKDFNADLKKFDRAGYPLSDGTFRVLKVDVAMGTDNRTHKAVELCWTNQNYCVVYDPSIENFNSIVDGLRERSAIRWSTKLAGKLNEAASPTGNGIQAKALARHCGLASHPSWTAAQVTWPAYRVSLKNIFRREIGHFNIGKVMVGLRCTRSCKPAPYGLMNESTGSIIPPNSVACDSAHNQGISGRTGKYVGRTGCAHRLLFGAKFNAEAKGVGLGAEVSIDSKGSVQKNGGAYVDTCGFF